MPETTNTSADSAVALDNININHPIEALRAYRGKYVAWSPDGREVRASGICLECLFEAIDSLGLRGDDYVVDYVSGPDEPMQSLSCQHQ